MQYKVCECCGERPVPLDKHGFVDNRRKYCPICARQKAKESKARYAKKLRAESRAEKSELKTNLELMKEANDLLRQENAGLRQLVSRLREQLYING